MSTAEAYPSKDPLELKEIARRTIDAGDVVLSAAGDAKIHRLKVELHSSDGHTELPIPTKRDAWDDAWALYSDYGKTKSQRHLH